MIKRREFHEIPRKALAEEGAAALQRRQRVHALQGVRLGGHGVLPFQSRLKGGFMGVGDVRD